LAASGFKRSAMELKGLPPCGHTCGPLCPADRPQKIAQIKPEIPNPNHFIFISRIVPTGGRGVVPPLLLLASIGP
jgi:hypothetical protein